MGVTLVCAPSGDVVEGVSMIGLAEVVHLEGKGEDWDSKLNLPKSSPGQTGSLMYITGSLPTGYRRGFCRSL